jgi:EAL domain-containing protein (putative c-di-GMP-specific phosphodiesterase class I)
MVPVPRRPRIPEGLRLSRRPQCGSATRLSVPKRIRTLGCSFALDDFGVGHGTFTYLKIDREFVRDLLKDESDRQVVQAIIGVAKQYQIKTIAERVEDQATLEELQRMGADYAQGFWIGRPAPFHEPSQLPSVKEQT